MKREEIMAILEDAGQDNATKLQNILNLNGADINSHKQRIKTLEDAAANHSAELEAERGKYKDYDTILQERDALKSEKEAIEFESRFSEVLGKNKPKNDFTKNGLIDLFKGEIAKDENKGKPDSEIFAAMVKGKEAEYFEPSVRINMSPINPAVQTPTNTEAYLDELYKNNPFYKTKN